MFDIFLPALLDDLVLLLPINLLALLFGLSWLQSQYYFLCFHKKIFIQRVFATGNFYSVWVSCCRYNQGQIESQRSLSQLHSNSDTKACSKIFQKYHSSFSKCIDSGQKSLSKYISLELEIVCLLSFLMVLLLTLRSGMWKLYATTHALFNFSF